MIAPHGSPGGYDRATRHNRHQSTEVAQGRYKAGVGSVLDLLAAQAALADARAQRVLTRLQWHTSLAQLAHDAGVLDQRGESSLRLAPDSASQTPGR